MTTIARYFALPILSAGILGGAALGMASMANAATPTQNDVRPGIVAHPNTKAHPAPNATPGWHNHHGIFHINDLHRQNHG